MDRAFGGKQATYPTKVHTKVPTNEPTKVHTKVPTKVHTKVPTIKFLRFYGFLT